MVDFDSLLNTKYSILGQHAQAAQLNAQAGMYGAQTARIAEQNRAPLYTAEANLQNTQAGILPQTAGAQTAYDYARTGALRAETENQYAPVSPIEAQYQAQLMRNPFGVPSASNLGNTSGMWTRASQTGSRFAAGTSQVKGPGGMMDDKVKAKLSPQEAVLNAGAADHLGQPLIQALNAVGLMKMGMGMVPAKGSADSQPTEDDRTKVQEKAQIAGKPGAYALGTSGNNGVYDPNTARLGNNGVSVPGFAKGVSKVSKGASRKPKATKEPQPQAQPSDTPTDLSQIDPQALAAAMQMGQVGQQLQGQPQGMGGGMPMGGMM